MSADVAPLLPFDIASSLSDERPIEDIGSTPTGRYEDDVSVEHRRRFGQVFTPPRLAALMADWIAHIRPASILDPAVGLGVLAAASLRLVPDAAVHCLDLDPVILRYMPPGVAARCSVDCRDFLTAPLAEQYDAIVMNPPYIRHRELQGHEARRAAVAAIAGCAIPRSANLYVDFVLKALSALRSGGRAAILIPSEWMSANFAASLKRKLADTGWLRGVVTFGHGSTIFAGALTTACLLLLEKGDASSDTVSYCLGDLSAATIPATLTELAATARPRPIALAALRDATKWEPILRGRIAPLPPGWTTLGMLAQPRRGIATGANGFFLVSRSFAEQTGLRPTNLLPCVGRARDVAGIVFGPDDFARLAARDAKVWLLDFASPPNADELTYICQGEQEGLTSRFLLRTRKPWFSMEQRPPSAIWAAVFARTGLRFVHNAAGAKSLTNFHCLYPRTPGALFSRALVAVLNGSAVRAAMVNHQRGFGGGLAKLEPNDLIDIPVPDLRAADARVLAALGSALDAADVLTRGGAPDPFARIDALVAGLGTPPLAQPVDEAAKRV